MIEAEEPAHGDAGPLPDPVSAEVREGWLRVIEHVLHAASHKSAPNLQQAIVGWLALLWIFRMPPVADLTADECARIGGLAKPRFLARAWRLAALFDQPIPNGKSNDHRVHIAEAQLRRSSMRKAGHE